MWAFVSKAYAEQMMTNGQYSTRVHVLHYPTSIGMLNGATRALTKVCPKGICPMNMRLRRRWYKSFLFHCLPGCRRPTRIALVAAISTTWSTTVVSQQCVCAGLLTFRNPFNLHETLTIGK